MPRGNGGIIGPVNTSFSGVWSLTEAQLRRSANTWPNFYAALLSESATGSDVFSAADNADPYFEYPTLLLPGSGTNGAQNNTFLDSSTNNFTITRNGNTTQGTFSPFSQTGWGNYFDGSGDYLSVASNAAFTLGSSSDFCIEGWIYSTGTPGTDAVIAGTWQNGSTTYANRWLLSLRTSGTAIYWWDSTGSPGITYTGITTNQWVHIAVVRNSGTITLYVNGVSRGTQSGWRYNWHIRFSRIYF